ncbi:hypothetical protein [Sulfitobacter sabulilitoris]|uniref:Uncharacterized protein n=1 Tax=Sulfitobacter sabulilitoris TaxID=2562655 RepID=A0A5S3PDK8_9RHOB|nr:hypothetical protein [Sulfitobacter sabulilitoris]TMM51039.1 hypothetical protein FDT80_14300 [Sulfitobacter sabulilitoris]
MRISDLKTVLWQMLLLVMSFVALSAVLLGLSLLVLPPPDRITPIDTFRAGATVYSTPPRLIYYGRKSLRNEGPKVILLGSSNTQVGFDRQALADRMEGMAVHNLGIGDANITEIAQIADLALSSIGSDRIKDQVFVIGIWYATFVDNANRWSSGDALRFETDIDRERYRYGFQRGGVNGPKVWISDRDADIAAVLVHPLIALEKGIRIVTADLRSLFFVRPPRIDTQTRNTMTPSKAQKAAALAYRAGYMKSERLSGEQYDVLDRLVRDLTGQGAHVVVADLPIPDWHAQGLPYHADHRERIAQVVAGLTGVERFDYVDLRHLDDPDSFYDDAHVRPRDLGPWVDALAARLETFAPTRITSATD